jgi:TonB family protein
MMYFARLSIPRALAGLLLTWVFLSSSAAGEAQGTTIDLGPRLERIDQLLREGDYEQARKESLRLADFLVDRAGPGRPGEVVLGRTSLFLALAEAGLGNDEEADWYYHVARGIDPELEDYDLDRFGEPGRLLQEIEVRRKRELSPEKAHPRQEQATAPRRIKSPQPEWPPGARQFGVTGALVVQAIIDRTGRPIRPTVLTPLPAATLTWAALEAVKEWRFEPSRLGGEPVSVYYNLTINYRLRSR